MVSSVPGRARTRRPGPDFYLEAVTRKEHAAGQPFLYDMLARTGQVVPTAALRDLRM